MRKDSQVRGPHGAETEPNVSSIWLMPTMLVVVVALACTGAFFFAATRGALIVRGFKSGAKSPDAHVYPIYSNMKLIRLVDFQPIIAAILLFQYDRLVSIITAGLRKQHLQGKKARVQGQRALPAPGRGLGGAVRRLGGRQRGVLPAARAAARTERCGAGRGLPRAGARRQALPGRVSPPAPARAAHVELGLLQGL